jgi:transcriptional regulator with XRE-family HTH domain
MIPDIVTPFRCLSVDNKKVVIASVACQATPKRCNVRRVETKSFDERVGANIRRVREAAGWSQADLAKMLTEHGLPTAQQTVYKIEHGARPLKLEESLAVVEILGVSITSLAQQFDNEKVGEAAAQIQRMNITIARQRRYIEVELPEKTRQSERDFEAFVERVNAEKRKVEQRMRDAGAVQDADGRWIFDGQVIDV